MAGFLGPQFGEESGGVGERGDEGGRSDPRAVWEGSTRTVRVKKLVPFH